MIDVTQWRPEFATSVVGVIFVAHCLLNENTRYLGGARCGGAVREIVQPCLEHDIGVVQPPCPEQHAWGGVLKRRFLFFHGSEDKLRYPSRPPCRPSPPPFLWNAAVPAQHHRSIENKAG